MIWNSDTMEPMTSVHKPFLLPGNVLTSEIIQINCEKDEYISIPFGGSPGLNTKSLSPYDFAITFNPAEFELVNANEYDYKDVSNIDSGSNYVSFKSYKIIGGGQQDVFNSVKLKAKRPSANGMPHIVKYYVCN